MGSGCSRRNRIVLVSFLGHLVTQRRPRLLAIGHYESSAIVCNFSGNHFYACVSRLFLPLPLTAFPRSRSLATQAGRI